MRRVGSVIRRNSWHGIDFSYHSDNGLDYLYRRYCESLLAVDDSVGRVIDQLKKMGVYDQTLIIYMGDNGFMWGEHGLIDKRVSYEASIRVPMMMQCPDLYKGGTVVEQVIGNIDVGPTILHAAGLQTPDYMDGKSFLELPNKPDMKWRDYFLYVYYWEKNFPQSPTQFALRGDRFKYITYYGLWDVDELYDLTTDPGETKNLINRSGLQVGGERDGRPTLCDAGRSRRNGHPDESAAGKFAEQAMGGTGWQESRRLPRIARGRRADQPASQVGRRPLVFLAAAQ